MGGRGSQEEALVHYPGAKLFQTRSRCTPSLGDGSRRFLGDIPNLAAVG